MAAELRAQWDHAVRGGHPVVLSDGLRVHYLADEGLRAYRRSLYGEPGRDWMPVLQSGFMGTLAFLVMFLAWLGLGQ